MDRWVLSKLKRKSCGVQVAVQQGGPGRAKAHSVTDRFGLCVRAIQAMRLGAGTGEAGARTVQTGRSFRAANSERRYPNRYNGSIVG
jgi:hypothetical protein